MKQVPSTRNQAVVLAEAIEDEADLTEEQTASFKNLYRLSDDRTVKELVTAGEIIPITDNDIYTFLEGLRRKGINNRADLDHATSFVRGITDPNQISVLHIELPKLLKGYFLQHCMRVLAGEP